MSHSRTVQDEFTRQASSFAGATSLQAAQITERVGEALGKTGGGRILDLACGPGVLTATLLRGGGRVVGLDLTAGALRLARDAADPERAVFVRGAAERVPLAAGRFDAVVIRLALHHVEEPTRVLGEARRALRRGGRLVVLDVLASDDPAAAALHNEIERARDPSHTAFVSGTALRATIEGAGFRVALDERFRSRRGFDEWAKIIAEPRRMARVERRMRELVRAGETLGTDLREEDGELCFDYRWALFAADAA